MSPRVIAPNHEAHEAHEAHSKVMNKRKALGDVDLNAVTQRAATKLKKGNRSHGLVGKENYAPPRPVRRIVVFRKVIKMVDVILWLLYMVVFDPPSIWQAKRVREGVAYEGDYRPTTYREAESWFKIPQSTIARWWQNRWAILAKPRHRTTRSGLSGLKEQYPELEAALFDKFVEWRHLKRPVSRAWFRRRAKLHFQAIYGGQTDSDGKLLEFRFSNGWFVAFCSRYGIVRRRLTKQAQRRPKDENDLVCSFLCFIRRQNTQNIFHGFKDNVIRCFHPDRFDKACILNMDEVPIPFEFLDGYSYDLCGAKTIAARTNRSGWGKRQATLVLWISADGICRIKPMLIFHGDEAGQLWEKENKLYDKRVTVTFNKTAYNNTSLVTRQLEHDVKPTLGDKPTLLVWDHAAFHKTDEVKEKLKELNITSAMIPAGCTSLLQPLDVAINKPFKEWLREATDDIIESMPPIETWTTSQRRILTTKIVGMAWEKLQEREKEVQLISRSFIHTGIAIKTDGSQDHLIRIKDHPNVSFKDWRLKPSPDVYIKRELTAEDDDLDEFLISEENEEAVLERLVSFFTTMKCPRLREEWKARSWQGYSKLTKQQLIQRLVDFEMERWRMEYNAKTDQEATEQAQRAQAAMELQEQTTIAVEDGKEVPTIVIDQENCEATVYSIC